MRRVQERKERERTKEKTQRDESGSCDLAPWYLREEVVASYEGWYTGKGERMDRLEKKLLRSLLDDFGRVHNLLEVGSGTTHFTRWFESLGVQAMGLDYSPLMLREARKWWDGPLMRGDAADLPFPADSFDVVAMIACFEYMPDPLKVLREAARVSRKGILMGLMNRWSWPTIRRRIQEFFGKNPFYTNAHFYSLPEFQRLLQRAFGTGYEPRWRSTLFPPFLPLEDAAVPLGAFLGVSVRFEDTSELTGVDRG